MEVRNTKPSNINPETWVYNPPVYSKITGCYYANRSWVSVNGFEKKYCNGNLKRCDIYAKCDNMETSARNFL